MFLRPAILSALILACSGMVRAGESSSLADAAERQDVATIKALLNEEANVNTSQRDGTTALHWAVYHEDVETAKRLVKAGANVQATNRYGVPPLSIACQNGNADLVRLLLESGANVNATLRGGETALMTAARTGDRRSVDALITHGANVGARERNGQTALMWAAAAGNDAVVGALIEAGADFRRSLKSGFTPIFFAAREGHRETVFRLLEAGIDVDQAMNPQRKAKNGPAEGMSLIMLAVENGHFELALSLLEAGANPSEDRAGYTPLHAITWVRKPIRGDGDPPPIGSGSLSSLELVRALAEQGADVNARHGKHRAGRSRLDRTDATPFLLASETGDLPLMKLLVELGADPQLPNAENCTPLLAAAGVGVLGNGEESAGTEEEAIAAVEYLLELGADINAVDDNGKSAMHGAAFKSWTNLIHFLADHGADIDVWNRKNSRGWTPLMIAQGHRPGNFRPSAETEQALRQVMEATNVRD